MPTAVGPTIERSRSALRDWTSSGGSHKTSAILVGLVDDKVQIEKAGGSVVTVPLEMLAVTDREYVKETLRIDPSAKVIIGQVTRVADGDTFTMVDEDKHSHTIRLEGIDSPEGEQEFGDEAKSSLIDKIFKKYPRVEWREFDRYSRVVGHVYLGDRYVNQELIAEGAAWHYKKYSSDPKLASAEVEAKSRRLGLWSDGSPIAPWDYRSGVRAPAVASAAPASLFDGGPAIERPADVSTQDSTVYVTRTGEKYHLGSCRYLRKSKIAISLRDAKASYSPCSVCGPP